MKRPGNLDVCAYCRAPATCIDHVIPASFYLIRGNEVIRGKKRGWQENLVHSCTECNLLASNFTFDNFWEKKSYIAREIEARYAKLLSTQDWDQDELSELHHSLRTHILEGSKLKQIIWIRLENLNTPEICLPIE